MADSESISSCKTQPNEVIELPKNSIDKEKQLNYEEKQEADQPNYEIENQATYQHILEAAPFPAFASIEEITRTLTNTKSMHTCTSKEHKDDVETGQTEEVLTVTTYPEPLASEGLSNRGWLVVLSTFLVNFYAFGTVFSWGNYQRLYLEDVYKGSTDQFRIAFVGTSATAMLLSTGLFITPFIERLGYRGTMVIGSILTPLGLILASFATQLWHVYLSQGILFGFGAAFVFSPSITLPSQWFVRNRAFATGIAVSGSGIGGVALSPMTQYLISTVGYRNSLRVMGGMGFGILGIATCLAFSRWRPAPSKNLGIFSIFDRSIISKHYLILLLFGFLAPFGYIGPFFLAPTYASHIGADSSTGASLVAIMSAMNAISRIVLGYMADYSGRFNTIFACTFFAGLFTMLIWQNSSTYGIYSAYTVLYGLTGGGFVSLFPVVTADIVGVQNIQRGLSLCYLATTLGNLLGTPIAGALQSAYGWTAAIQFSGAPSVLAALVILTLRMMRSKGKIFVKI